MERRQGFTLGAILAASVLLRPGMPTSSFHSDELIPKLADAAANSNVGSSLAKASLKDGPWLASCRYWAPARDVGEVSRRQERAKEQTPDIKGELQKGNHELDVYLDLKATGRDWGCGGDVPERWGLPDPPNASADRPAVYAPHITAVVATVPDPIHGHLALSFDRAIVAILEAASDNHYVSSSYWLPWTLRGGAGRGEAGVGEPESGHDPEREQEPGLIVLRHVPLQVGSSSGFIAPSESYYDVIYLFLVAETPTQGVDGFQLSHAFAYEKELADGLKLEGRCDPASHLPDVPANQSRFRRGKGCHVSIIGPLYTGSTASLRVGIEDAHARYPGLDVFDVKGGRQHPLLSR